LILTIVSFSDRSDCYPCPEKWNCGDGDKMPISNDQELVRAVAQASELVQNIQDYCGRKLRDDSKINFPRGLIGTAASYRERCPTYLTADQISSCAYGFMYLDVLWWLLSRSDISSVGKQMSLKSAIVTLGTILEVSLQVPGLPRNKVLSKKCNAGVKPRVQDSVKRGWISKEQGTALEQCWEHRNNVHLKLLEKSELDLYTVDHVNAPHAALLVLLPKLKEWNGKDI
jgi:hypothetical protein